MGWTSKFYRGTNDHTSFSESDVINLLTDEYVSQGCQFAGIHLHKAKDKHDHNEVYCLMQHINSSIPFIMVILIDIVKDEIFWKEIDESMGPSYYNCPKEFFKFCEAKDYAVNWRSECEKRNIIYKQIML